MRSPLNNVRDFFLIEICLYIEKKKKKHDLQSKALTGLFATTPPNGNESKIFSCTSLKDIPIALITTDLLLTQSADLS